MLVTTPEWVTSTAVLAALEHLEHECTTVAANKFHARGPADLRELERRLRERRLRRSIAIPHDEQLASMLDTGTYEVDARAPMSPTGSGATLSETPTGCARKARASVGGNARLSREERACLLPDVRGLLSETP